jgi:hypothetical protein
MLAFCSVGLKVALTDMLQAYRTPGQPLPVGRPGLPPGNGLLPNPQAALQYHYGISAEVLEAADWIRRHSEPGQRFLCDSWDLPTNARGALVGAVGLLPAMEANPPVEARSIDSYQPNLQQRGFWATGDPMRLSHEVDWLLITRSSRGYGQPVFQVGQARVYKVPERDDPPVAGAGAFQLEFARHGVVGSSLELRYKGPLGCLFELRFAPLDGQEFVADQNLQSTSAADSIMFILPYAVGRYELQARLSREAEWQDFGTVTVDSVGLEKATEPESAAPSATPPPTR